MMQKKGKKVSTANCNCRVCNGTGWEIRLVIEKDGYEHFVGGPCPACSLGRTSDDQRIRSGIPSKFYEVTLPDFQWKRYREDIRKMEELAESFVKDFEKWKDERFGLFIWSQNRGTGKTMLASAISNSLMIKHGISLRFINVPEYLETVKTGFKRQPEEPDRIRQYYEADVLVLDDLGAEKQSDWQAQELFRLVDSRYTEGKIIVVTSNYAIDQLPVDSRIVDRLYDSCIQLHLPEQSIRAERASEKKDRFIKKIMAGK